MTDSETLDKAKALFTGATQGDKLAREVIAIAERATQKAALWEELADQRALEIDALNKQRDEKWEQAQAEADSASPYSYAGCVIRHDTDPVRPSESQSRCCGWPMPSPRK